MVVGYIDNVNILEFIGISILLYGEFGIGKIELVWSLVEYCGYILYEVSVKVLVKVNKSWGFDNKILGKECMVYLVIFNGLLIY